MPKRKNTYTKKLREWIYERDEGLCQVCGRRGDQVHHVITRGRFYTQWYTFTDVNDERNLMLICYRCHDAIHRDNELLERVIEIQEARFGALRKGDVTG